MGEGENKLPSPAITRQITVQLNGMDIVRNEVGHVNLTQLWQAAESPTGKEPTAWRRRDDATSFISDLASNLNMRQSHVLTPMRGRGGATWAHWQIAIAYAKHLSTEFHRLVNEAFREMAKEAANPALKAERAVEGFRRQKNADGTRRHSDAWIGERLEGIAQRKALTDTMSDHNCKVVGRDNPFAEATRAISLQVLGKTPGEIKKAKSLPARTRTRDHLDKFELNRMRFAESEAERLMEEEATDGNVECVDACRRAAKGVRVALDFMAKSKVKPLT